MAYVTDEIPELEPIRDEEWLTQYGRQGPDGSPNFTTVPTNPDLVRPSYLGRQPTANAMSVLRGRKSVEEATRTVCRRRARAGDGVRYAQAGTFRAEDFTVNPTPRPDPLITARLLTWTYPECGPTMAARTATPAGSTGASGSQPGGRKRREYYPRASDWRQAVAADR